MSKEGGASVGSRKLSNASGWILSGVLAAAFLAAGGAKLAGAPPMVAIFDQIGIGQWFRFVTATVEIIGAVLLLWPAQRVYGALVLACTMVGAVFTHVFVIGGNWAPAAILLGLILVVLAMNRSRLAPDRSSSGQRA